jgi:hypothetical protein
MQEPKRSHPGVPNSGESDLNGEQANPVPGPVLLSPPPAPEYRWYHKVAGVAAAVFCFELGVFLLLFPWATQWDVSYGAFLPLWARPIWANPYFRGAISGLGMLNIYIAFLEVFRLRRFSG